MNAFIKYLGKEIAEDQNLTVLKEKEWNDRILSALVSLVGARLFIADAKVLGIVKTVDEDEEGGE